MNDLCVRLYQYILTNNYNHKQLASIILSDKYSIIWTSDEHQMIGKIAYVLHDHLIGEILYKYKMITDVIIKSKDLLLGFIYKNCTILLNKYDIADQQIIIKAVLQNNYVLNYSDKEALKYMLHICDYTIIEWESYYKIVSEQKTTIYIKLIIYGHIYQLICYDQSLRNAWILSCMI